MAAVTESDNRVGARLAGARAALAQALLARHALPLALLLALVVRAALIARAPGILDGDEALVGIQAESIAAGAARPLPVYFYGQHYMGSLEAYLAAGVFRLAGPSVPALRLVPLAFALLLTLLTYELARRIVGRQAARAAALLAAVAPLYPAVWSVKARGGYVETLALGSALLIVTHRLLYGPGEGLGLTATVAPPRRGPARLSIRSYLGRIDRRPPVYLLWGLLAGLLFWTNPVGLYYIVAGAGALAVGALRRRGPRLWRADVRGRLLRAAPPSLIPIVIGALVGGLPLWVDNILYARGATFAYLLAPSNGHGQTLAHTIEQAPRVAAFLVNSIAPKLAGAWEPWDAVNSPIVGAIVLALYALSVAYLLLRLAAGRRGLLGYRARPRHGQGLLLSFALVVAVVFCLSSFGGEALNPLGFDAASRYALPLVSVLPVAAGALVWWLWRARAPLGAAALAVLVGANALGLVRARPNEVFQSEYWGKLPPSEAPLATFLKANNIHSVWINHWAGYPLMFYADAYAPGHLAAFDYNDVALNKGVDRLPWARKQVMGDPRAAFVLVTPQTHPPLEGLLRAQKITFKPQRIGPYLVYYNLSRRVDPHSVREGLGFSY